MKKRKFSIFDKEFEKKFKYMKRSTKRNKERNRYANLKAIVTKCNKGIDPLGIPNCNFSCIDYFDDTDKDLKRLAKFKQQRIERGFDDTECWNLDRTIAAFILPRLKVFRNDTAGYPGTEEVGTFEKWQEILDKMIYAFDHIVNEEKYDDARSEKYGITWNDYFTTKHLENGNYEVRKTENYPEDAMKLYHEDKIEEGNKMQEGFDLFSKYFLSLWW